MDAYWSKHKQNYEKKPKKQRKLFQSNNHLRNYGNGNRRNSLSTNASMMNLPYDEIQDQDLTNDTWNQKSFHAYPSSIPKWDVIEHVTKNGEVIRSIPNLSLSELNKIASKIKQNQKKKSKTRYDNSTNQDENFTSNIPKVGSEQESHQNMLQNYKQFGQRANRIEVIPQNDSPWTFGVNLEETKDSLGNSSALTEKMQIPSMFKSKNKKSNTKRKTKNRVNINVPSEVTVQDNDGNNMLECASQPLDTTSIFSSAAIQANKTIPIDKSMINDLKKWIWDKLDLLMEKQCLNMK